MKKIGVIFGGISTESEISKKSADSILKNLDKNKYNVYPIYIDKKGIWYEENEKIENIEKYIKKFDVIFPVLHGIGGEDGTLQGMLEMFAVPYVGCKILASSVGMDKVYTKIIFEKANINQAKYVYIKSIGDKYIYVHDNLEEEIFDLNDICKKINEKLKFPVFVKPSNSGSSVGVNKAKNIEELLLSINIAKMYDKKILVEEEIVGKEVECAVLGNEIVKASCVGEIIPAEEFYSFDAKYKMKESKIIIPANIDENISEEIKRQAIKAFKAIDGSGLSRVDFFIEDVTNEIYINEINTLPGFTDISMYPQLFKESGIEYSELLDNLIDLALEGK